MSTVLEQLSARAEKQRQAAAEDYRLLVEAIAYDTADHTADEAEAILRAAGKETHDLSADVGRKRQIIQCLAEIEAGSTGPARAGAARAEIEALNKDLAAKIEVLQQRHREAIAPHAAEIEQGNADTLTGAAAKRRLLELRPDEATAYSNAQDALRRHGDECHALATQIADTKRRLAIAEGQPEASSTGWNRDGVALKDTVQIGNLKKRLSDLQERLETEQSYRPALEQRVQDTLAALMAS